MSEITKGVWRYDEEIGEIYTIDAECDFETTRIADVPNLADGHAIAATKELLEADEAAVQCIVDFLECYKCDCARVVMDEAVKSLKNDALPKLRAAITKAQGEPKP